MLLECSCCGAGPRLACLTGGGPRCISCLGREVVCGNCRGPLVEVDAPSGRHHCALAARGVAARAALALKVLERRDEVIARRMAQADAGFTSLWLALFVLLLAGALQASSLPSFARLALGVSTALALIGVVVLLVARPGRVPPPDIDRLLDADVQTEVHAGLLDGGSWRDVPLSLLTGEQGGLVWSALLTRGVVEFGDLLPVMWAVESAEQRGHPLHLLGDVLRR